MSGVTGVDYRRPTVFRRGSLVVRTRHHGDLMVPLVRRDRREAESALRALQGARSSAAQALAPSPAPSEPAHPAWPQTAVAGQASAPVVSRSRGTNDGGGLLVLPTRGERYRVDRWAVVDLETTGLDPRRGGRIVEVSVVTVENDRITDKWSTLINPGRGRGTGPVHIHRITEAMVADAPHLRDVAADIEERLSGAALVAHNAPFEGRFLDAGFAGIGRPLPHLPALDTLQLARAADLPTPNLRLATLADWAGIPLVDAHTALADATATARLLPVLIDAARLVEPSWRVPALCAAGSGGGPTLQRPPGDPFAAEVAGYELADGLRKGSEGWIANLLARMPSLPGEGDPDTEQYLELVTGALADGKIVGTEARELAILAGSIGLSADQAHTLHMQVLDSMAEVALADGVLTSDEHRLLTRAAESMNAAGRFDCLASHIAYPAGHRSSGGKQKKCGNCGGAGHNRRTCAPVA